MEAFQPVPSAQGCAKVLINGTADGIAAHVKTLFDRGFDIVKELRAILDKNGHDADESLPMKSDKLFLNRLGALMHDTCATANLAAKRIIEAKNELGVATFGAAGWATLSPEDRETFDGLCANHTRQRPVTAYDRSPRPLFTSSSSTSRPRSER